jgi:TolB-like protein
MSAIAASVALEPFENLSGDPAQDALARGFVEDIATALSRFSTLEIVHPRVVAGGAVTQAGAGTSAKPGASADAVSASMATTVLRGSVRRAGDKIRIAVQLLDAQGGRQIWADRYDVTAGNLFEIQDEIAERVASALAIGLDRRRLDAVQRAPLASLEIYDCWLRGLDCLQQGTVEADVEARRFFTRALESDPGFARAYAGLSLSYFNEWSCQAWHKWDETERQAYEYAARAVRLDDGDPMVQVVLGRILVYRHQFEEASYHVDRALRLNPSDPEVLVHAALCKAYLGDGEAALELSRKAMRLNPSYPPWYFAPLGCGLFILGRDAEVMALGSQVPITTFVDLPALLAASMALSGDVERARSYLSRFLAAFGERVIYGRAPEPGEPLRWLLHINPFRLDEHAQRLARGLRAAGLEDDPDERRPEAAPKPVPRMAACDARFQDNGDTWLLAFDGLSVQLTAQKGFSDIARLLRQPGVEMHCLELAGRPAEPNKDAPVLDARATREVRERLRELQHEVEEADAAHDLGRAERAREELDRIVEVMAGALGLGGRSRALGSAAERARSAVTWRIRSAIKKIAKAHPRLGRHLENSVRTGTFCVYEPETAVRWG